MDQLSQPSTDTTDQGDQEILAFTLSDEALETAAGADRAVWSRCRYTSCFTSR